MITTTVHGVLRMCMELGLELGVTGQVCLKDTGAHRELFEALWSNNKEQIRSKYESAHTLRSRCIMRFSCMCWMASAI